MGEPRTRENRTGSDVEPGSGARAADALASAAASPASTTPAAELGPVTLFALGVNGIVGAGIFFAPAIVAASLVGARASWLYVLVAIGCLPVALVFARLARALPHDGGPCLYAERAFGHGAARAIGALVWVSSLFSSATVTRALAELLAQALPQAARFATAGALAPAAGVLIVVVLAFVNLRGLRISALAWTALTVLKIAPLVALVAIAPFATLPAAASAPPLPAVAPLGPALLAILFALQGFEIVPLPAGRVRDAKRTVPRATVASLVVAGVLYALIHLACARALPTLRDTVAPIPAAAAIVGGPRLAWAIGAGVIASIAGITVGMHAMTPRYLSAITEREPPVGGVAGAAAPASAEAGSMVRPVIVSAAVVGLMVAIGPVAALAGLSSIAVLAQYGVTAAALAVLALRRAEGLTLRDAWPAPLAMVVVVALLSQATRLDLAIAAGVIAAAIAWGWVARRRIAGTSPR
jgi:amino acid transporter